MKLTKYYLFIFTLLFTFSVKAQEVTDYDLQNFARAYKEMVNLNTKAQKEMTKIIANEDLDLEVYHAIEDTKDLEIEPDVPEEDFKKYNKVQPKIQAIQKELEADVEKAYAQNDLTKQKYSAIAERVKQDYMLQAKLEQIFEKMGR